LRGRPARTVWQWCYGCYSNYAGGSRPIPNFLGKTSIGNSFMMFSVKNYAPPACFGKVMPKIVRVRVLLRHRVDMRNVLIAPHTTAFLPSRTTWQWRGVDGSAGWRSSLSWYEHRDDFKRKKLSAYSWCWCALACLDLILASAWRLESNEKHQSFAGLVAAG